MAFFVLSFFPLDVLDEIWDLIESVSGGFLTNSCYFCESSCLFYLIFNFDFYVSRIMHFYELGIFHANRTTKCLRNQGRTKSEGWSTSN